MSDLFLCILISKIIYLDKFIEIILNIILLLLITSIGNQFVVNSRYFNSSIQVQMFVLKKVANLIAKFFRRV